MDYYQCIYDAISIHALREEGDSLMDTDTLAQMDFYPRPPRGGRHKDSSIHTYLNDFYPRPPRGGRLRWALLRPKASKISIHALREEGDRSQRQTTRGAFYFYPRPPRGGRRCQLALGVPAKLFLSTPSARRATSMSSFGLPLIALFLSTPSARRATVSSRKWSGPRNDFYPRPPRGGRRSGRARVRSLV